MDNIMITGAELSENNRPSVADAMQACEKNSSAKEDSAHNMRLLPEGYQPGEHDVLCGRGRKCFNHAGNVKFRAIVQSFLPQYSKAVAKLEKSYILSDVVEQVRKNSGEGGFIKKDPDTGRWYEVGDFLAREKTSQAFRDVLHDKYKSSNTAKKKRRQEEQAEKLFRAHSNRSLGANSLDASSVHSVGSSTTGDYMLSDSKLMRTGGLERSGSILNLGEAEDGGEGQQPQHDDLLGGLDRDIANYGRPRMFNRQRSLRSVLDFDTNRRAVMSNAKPGGTSFYDRSSCPNLFAPPQRSNSGPQPPISQIEIIQEEAGHQQRQPQVFQPGVVGSNPNEFNDVDSLNGDNGDVNDVASASSNNNNNGGGGSSNNNGTAPSQNWFHHSQPNLFGSAPPVNPQAGARQPFARQPVQLPNRPGSSSSGMLAGVQQQIGNLGLNDNSSHGQPFGADTQGANSFLPHGLQQQQAPHLGAPQGLQPQQGKAQPAMSLTATTDASSASGNSSTAMDTSNNGGVGGLDDEDADLLARLSALENTAFGMDVIDENPFEPVPLREG